MYVFGIIAWTTQLTTSIVVAGVAMLLLGVLVATLLINGAHEAFGRLVPKATRRSWIACFTCPDRPG